ncbi:MAG: hypothetical protein EZS28_052453, partial [Streblomastix strix]
MGNQLQNQIDPQKKKKDEKTKRRQNDVENQTSQDNDQLLKLPIYKLHEKEDCQTLDPAPTEELDPNSINDSFTMNGNENVKNDEDNEESMIQEDNIEQEKQDLKQIISTTGTSLPIKIISGKIGISSPTASYLSSDPNKINAHTPVIVHELDQDEQILSSQFEAEAYQFFLGNYCGVKESLFLNQPFVYWMTIKQNNRMRQCLADF